MFLDEVKDGDESCDIRTVRGTGYQFRVNSETLPEVFEDGKYLPELSMKVLDRVKELPVNAATALEIDSYLREVWDHDH